MNRDGLLALRRIETVTVDGVTVFVKRWSGRARLAFDDAVSAQKSEGRIEISPVLPLVFALSVVSKDGDPLFGTDKQELDAIESGVSGDVTIAVFDWAIAANGLLKAGRDEAIKN
jgi:hypothetical protein